MAVVDLLELPSALPPYAPVIGLDLGEKTIGVAVSDATRAIASPLAPRITLDVWARKPR